MKIRYRILGLWILGTLSVPSSFANTTSEGLRTAPPQEMAASVFYRFEQFSLRSADAQRHYQITLAIPNGSMPKQGYPVLYMLDGDAVVGRLTDDLFAGMQGADWPVVVTIGYKKDRQVARVYDYTPPLVDQAQAPAISQFNGRHGNKNSQINSYGGEHYGGAELFWLFLEQVVKPKVAEHVTLDNTRQSLWGHSFGGLFVLHTLFTHPESFQTYIAADASLWWQQGQILAAERAFSQRSARPPVDLLLQRSASHRPGDTLPKDETRRLAQRLSLLPEFSVQYHDYFQHHHGSVRAVSIPAALRMAQGIEQQ